MYSYYDYNRSRLVNIPMKQHLKKNRISNFFIPKNNQEEVASKEALLCKRVPILVDVAFSIVCTVPKSFFHYLTLYCRQTWWLFFIFELWYRAIFFLFVFNYTDLTWPLYLPTYMNLFHNNFANTVQRSFTCALPGFFWLLGHVIYLKLTKVL